MKTSEFNKTRTVTVTTDDETFYFLSYAEMLGNFDDITNSEQWAKSHDNVVFVAHRFDTIGEIIETFENNEDAENYANQLNEYYAICENYLVE